MKKLLFALLVACGSKTPPKPPPVVMEPAPQGEVVTAQVLEMNGAKYGRPPTDYRTGNVTPIALPKPLKTGQGFEGKFTSGAPITTPAVYEGKILGSGLFR